MSVMSRPPAALPGTGTLLHLMRDGTVRTRAGMAESTGLARTTVGTAVDSLVGSGLLRAHGPGVSTGGRRPTQFAFNTDAHVVVAAQLGTTHGTIAITDLGGSVLAERTELRAISGGPRDVLDWLLATAGELLIEIDRPAGDVVGVGIGVPGPVEHSSGRPTNPPIMPGWHGYDVVGHVRQRFDVPVLVDNDVNVMALGEHATAHPDAEHLLFVKVGTGIGSGIVAGGVLNRGAHGVAGDLGHVRAPHGDQVPCVCGNVGCLEAIASGAAIAARLRTQGVAADSSTAVVELVRGGDLAATHAVRQAGRDIGEVLAGCVSLLNPSVIVIGGALAEAGESLLAGVREVVYGRSLPLSTEGLRIVTSHTGDQAYVTGAATMVIEHVLSPATSPWQQFADDRSARLA